MEDGIYLTQSPKVDSLEKALFKSRAAMGNAARNKINPHFKSKYADLESLRDAADPVLEEQGLMVVNELLYSKELGLILYTSLIHPESGQWKNYSQIPISPVKINDPQAIGAYITYAERYAYKLVTGINVSDRTDDDGERAQQYFKKQTFIPKEPILTLAQKTDITLALSELNDKGKRVEDWIFRTLEIQDIASIPQSQYQFILSTIDKARAKEIDGNSEKN